MVHFKFYSAAFASSPGLPPVEPDWPGCAVAGPENRILDAMRRATAREGISVCPETAACILAVEIMVSDDRINRDERVLVFNTGSATKYVETVSLDLPVIADPDKFDYESIA